MWCGTACVLLPPLRTFDFLYLMGLELGDRERSDGRGFLRAEWGPVAEWEPKKAAWLWRWLSLVLLPAQRKGHACSRANRK